MYVDKTEVVGTIDGSLFVTNNNGPVPFAEKTSWNTILVDLLRENNNGPVRFAEKQTETLFRLKRQAEKYGL